MERCPASIMPFLNRGCFLLGTIFSLLPYSECNCLWKGLFHDSDLTFIFTPNMYKILDVDGDSPYFQDVRSNNAYTPIRHLVLHQREMIMPVPLEINFINKFKHRPTEKLSRPKVAFAPLHGTMEFITAQGLLQCEYIFHISHLVFRQEYFSGHINSPRSKECLHRHADWLGTLKLVLFKETLPVRLLIPCLTCNPKIFSAPRTFSLLGIRRTWDTQNRDMHKYLVLVHTSVQAKCGLLYKGLANLTFSDFCLVAAIAEKYNLAVLEYSTGRHFPFEGNFGFALAALFDEFRVYHFVYQVEFISINFMTVTNPPSPAGGVSTFVSPLDLETWSCLIISILSAAGILTLIQWNGDVKIWTSLVATMAGKVITVSCIYLGQVGESSGRAYREGKAVWIMVTLWLFGNMILMGNFYQGSIFSCLTVLLPSQTPEGINDLVNWDIPLVSIDLAGDKDSPLSLLLHYVIPKLQRIYGGGKNLKFQKFLTKFQAKVLLIQNQSVWHMTNKIMTENSTRRHPTIALFMLENDLQHKVRSAKLQGTRHIVRNKGDTPFGVRVLHGGNYNMLAPYFAKEKERLHEFGLNQMWRKVYEIAVAFRGADQANNYFKLVQFILGNLREPVTFHESQLVSMALILPVFTLCGVLMTISIVGFMAEDTKLVWKVGKVIVLGIINVFIKIGRIRKIFGASGFASSSYRISGDG